MLTNVPLARGGFNWKVPVILGGDLGTTPLEIHSSNGDLYSFSISIVLGPQSFHGEFIIHHLPIGQAVFFGGKIYCHGGNKMRCHKELRFKPAKVSMNDDNIVNFPFKFDGGIEGTPANIYEARINLIIEIRPLQTKPVSSLPLLGQTIGKLFLDPHTSDILIICDDVEFPCHRFMLSLRSEVFQAMFSIDSQEKQENIIKISDITARTMRTFLKFVYTDSVELKEITCDLLKAADKYNFQRLIGTVQHCSNSCQFCILFLL